MVAYNKTTLINLRIAEEVSEAVEEGYISQTLKDDIINNHPVELYRPNIFVAIGLGLLTLIVGLSVCGLLLLLMNFGISSFGFFMEAILMYAALEHIVTIKKHYNSGVDTVLIILAAVFLGTSVSFAANGKAEDILLSFCLMLFSFWCVVRFASALAAGALVICTLLFTFNTYTSVSESTIYSFPFVLIIVSAFIYYFSSKLLRREKVSIYDNAYLAIKVVAIFGLYACGNYYLVDKMTERSYLLIQNSALLWSWFFWSWTFLIPVVIVVRGIKIKDIALVRSGAILIVASIVTFRMYHEVLSLEAALIAGGALLLSVTYILMQKLKVARHGFIYNFKTNKNRKYADLEAFAISQAFHTQQPAEPATKFEGGSFGGAGAGSSY